jgi:hypothetical protein
MANPPARRIVPLLILLVAQVVVLVFFLHRNWDPPTLAQKASTGADAQPAASPGAKEAVVTAETSPVRTPVGENAAGAPRPDEKSILLIVLLAGALGGSLHALSSFIGYVGNKTFDDTWIPWYLCRAPIGAGLGMAVYLALRAGLMTSAVSNEGLNIFGFAAISLLTGLFNRNATAKLVKVSEAIFTAAPPEGDPLNPTIVVTKMVPAAVTFPVTNPQEIVMTGSGFTNDISVLVDGNPLPSTDVMVESDTQLKLAPTTLITVKGTKKIQVVRAGENAAMSNIVEFAVK